MILINILSKANVYRNSLKQDYLISRHINLIISI
jgi:hypothetical protein